MFTYNPMRRRVPILKRLVPSLKKRIGAFTLSDGFKLARSGGALFLLQIGNYVDRQIAFYNDYERAQIARLLKELRARRCEWFIDVGANLGYYTVRLALEPTVHRVVAFEPDPRNFDQLRANLFLNRLSLRVESHRLAISDHGGSVALDLFPEGATGRTRVSAGKGFEVPAARLDDVLPLEGQKIALKVDVEGHELQAVSGMPRLLAQNDCLLQIESFADRIEPLRRRLGEAGYREFAAIGDDHFFARHAGG